MSDIAGPAPKMPRLGLEPAPMEEHTIRFDDPDPNLHDVVINVHDRKFYCSKMTLAKHSRHFYDMFYKDPKHIGKTEVTLEQLSADDFEAFLKILHGVNEFDEVQVSGVLRMAVSWKCGVAVQQCVNFLKTSSCILPIEEKYHLATQYGLEDLKKEIISNIESTTELKTLLPADFTDLDQSTMALFLKKSVELHDYCENNHPRRYPYSPTSPAYSPTSPSYSPSSPSVQWPDHGED